jgi:hypothetical protein
MKQLQANGSVLILSGFKRFRVKPHVVPWADNATEWYATGDVPAQSGTMGVMSSDFMLKDGSIWHYISAMGDETSELILQDRIYSFPNGNNNYPQIGEGFNYLCRPKVFAKWTDDELSDWLDAH